MKLVNIIKNLVYEQLDTIEDAEKLFGHDIYSIFDYYKKNDQLDQLVDLFDEDNYLKIVPPLVDSSYKPYEKLAFDLVSRDIGDVKQEGDKYFLYLDNENDLSQLFSTDGYYRQDIPCRDLAEQIFSEEGLDWEPHYGSMSLEDIVGNVNEDSIMSEENYQKLVDFLLENFSNMEVSSFREEFGSWVDADKLGDRKSGFILTPDRIMSVAKDRYNMSVLIGNTEELEEVEGAIRDTFDTAYNDISLGEYYNTYVDAVREILPQGESVQSGSSRRRNKEGQLVEVPNWKYKIDITDKFWDVIKQWESYADPYLEEGSWFGTLVTAMEENDYNGGLLCPRVSEYPDNTEVENHFNEIFIDELNWRTS
tara:strand:- start:10521 stop:11615 length:1095 start_codon:yes stop_codon:yes gene_type:complete